MSTPGILLKRTVGLKDPVDGIVPCGIKRQVLFNAGNCLMWVFVGPNGVHRFRSAYRTAVICAIAFVWTLGVMLSSNEKRHVRIAARQVVDGSISRLFQPKRLRRFGDDLSSDRHTDPA